MKVNSAPPAPGYPFDNIYRWLVDSRSKPGETYLVELLSYERNGICQCPDFACRMEPLLALLIPPEQATSPEYVREKTAGQYKSVKLKPGKHPKDALRCDHIIEARRAFCDFNLNTAAAVAEAHNP